MHVRWYCHIIATYCIYFYVPLYYYNVLSSRNLISKGNLSPRITVSGCRYKIAGRNAFCSMFKGLLQASLTVRKCGVITKYTEISIDGNPLKFYLEPIVKGDTYQFTATRNRVEQILLSR